MTPDATAAASADARGSEVPFGEDGDDMATADTSSDEEQFAEDTAPFENYEKETAGSWTRKESDEVKRSNFGIWCGNRGGNPHKQKMLHEHMLCDILENPGHVICTQDMEEDVCEWLRECYDIPDDSLVRDMAHDRSRGCRA